MGKRQRFILRWPIYSLGGKIMLGETIRLPYDVPPPPSDRDSREIHFVSRA